MLLARRAGLCKFACVPHLSSLARPLQVFDSEPQAALYANQAVAYMWDDHDFGGNNADGFNPSKGSAL